MAASRTPTPESPSGADPGELLEAAVRAHCPEPTARLLLAVSGGVDSTALMLLAAARLGRARLSVGHVHHGMQAGADGWAEQVRCQAAALGLNFHSCHLDGRAAAARRYEGLGPEGWARRERYRALGALARQLGAAAVLVAHHRDDQIETHLLQAQRGAGDRGRAAMAVWRPLLPGPAGRTGPGLLRPFLTVPRSRLAAIVWQAGWRPVLDPSNEDPARPRSRLRLTRAAHDDVDTALLAVIARHQARDETARQVAAADLTAIESGFTSFDEDGAAPRLLSRRALAALPPVRRAEVWRYWLEAASLGPPTRRRLAELDRQMVDIAAVEARVAHQGRLVVRHRDRIGLLERLPEVPPPLRCRDPGGSCLDLARIDGRWVLSPCPVGQGSWAIRLPADLPAEIEIGPGRADDRWRAVPMPSASPGGRAERSHSLRKLWQEGGLPTWLRPALPVVREAASGRLLAAFPFGRSAVTDCRIDCRVLRWQPLPAWLPWLQDAGRPAPTAPVSASI